MKGQKVISTIGTTGTGYGFISKHDGLDRDIFINTQDLGTALNGDTVEVEITGEGEKGRFSGKVLRVIERAKLKYVGTLQKAGDVYFLKPDDQKMYVDIFIPPSKDPKVGDKIKVYAEITEWDPKRKNPTGRILEVLGPKGVHEVEMKSIVLERGIQADFPPDVEREAEKIKQAFSIEEGLRDPRRKDVREKLTFTIDPDTAKDFDDALSFIDNGNGTYEIGIHIADVAHFVRPGMALDKEARNRAFTTYLVDRTIPMLPEILSNDLCSLNPKEDKFAFSAIFTMNDKGEVLDRWFGRTIIHSDHRYTYEDAQAVIDSGVGPEDTEHGSDTHVKALQKLNEIAKVMRKKRFEAGSIEFNTEEVKFQLDDEGKPIGIIVKERLDTHMLVEEYMLLANVEVALEVKRLSEKYNRDLIFIYRVHDEPDRDRLEELEIFIQALGYEFKLPKEKITGMHLNELIKEAEERPEEGLINTTMVRSMAKAHYSTHNIGHFGLAFSDYAHFTSPIRRYPDTLVHRLLSKHLYNEVVPTQEYPWYEKTAEHCSEQEVTVMQAERESIRYKQVEYMKEHIGETFEAIVSGLSEYGLFIEEKKTKANGFVHVRTMTDDTYSLDTKSYALIGAKTGTKYALGSEIKVKLISADMDKRNLDFEVVK